MSVTYFHGGKPGLSAGDMLIPSPPHVSDGCPICVARAAGRTCTVGEYRRWAMQLAVHQRDKILAALGDANDAEPIDPPSAKKAVYITTDQDYALWYAARSRGDLYRVVPIGKAEHSPEDNFPSFTCRAALVAEVVKRKVRLRDRERRRIDARWKLADANREASSLSPLTPTGGNTP